MLANFENGSWEFIDDVPTNEIPSLKEKYPTQFKIEGQLGTYYICWNINQGLLPASKNIGATHLTGGCFRLHPVEWTVGEAAGYLAAYCIRNKLTPAQVADQRLSDFQRMLMDHGFQLHWESL